MFEVGLPNAQPALAESFRRKLRRSASCPRGKETTWPSRCEAAYTYVEMLVASGIATVLIAVILAMYFYGEQCFSLMTSYSELDGKSQNAITVLSEEIRESTQVTRAQTNSDGKSLTLTNAIQGTAVNLVWDSTAQTVTITKGTNSSVLLTGCNDWNYTLYDGAPVFNGANVSFGLSSSPSTCRLIEMSWTCSRNLVGKGHAKGVECVRFGLRNPTQ